MPFCAKCIAIAEELGLAYRELWANKDLWGSGLSGDALTGGTDQDVQRPVELPTSLTLESSARISYAIISKFTHETMTGHEVPRLVGRKSALRNPLTN